MGLTIRNPDWIRTILETGNPGVSMARQDSETGRWVVNIGVPVRRGGTTRYVLGARLFARVFSEILARQNAPPGGVLTVLDSTPAIVARSRNEDKYVGTVPTADFVARSRSSLDGAWRSVLLEGTPAYSAWSRSPSTGWTVGIGLPSDAVDGPMRRSFGTPIPAWGTIGAVLSRRDHATSFARRPRRPRPQRRSPEASRWRRFPR
jgi:hypothetical protein